MKPLEQPLPPCAPAQPAGEPWSLRVGRTPVRVRFTAGAPTLEEKLTAYWIGRKQRPAGP